MKIQIKTSIIRNKIKGKKIKCQTCGHTINTASLKIKKDNRISYHHIACAIEELPNKINFKAIDFRNKVCTR